MDWFGDVAQNARDLELGSWAGLVNIVGLLALIRLTPSVRFSERALQVILLLVEGSRRYRAQRSGFTYRPAPRPRVQEPERWSRVRNLCTLTTYLVVCVAVIGASYQLS